MTSTVAQLLNTYHPLDLDEAADVTRLRELVATTVDPWSRASALHITGSALIVHPPTARVLLRWHRRQQAWLQVGGHADPGETDPIDIALREGREETGLADLVPWPDATLVHVVIVPVPASRDDRAHEHADLRFVVATADPEAARPEQPDATVRWLSVPDAYELTTVPNLWETLARTDKLFAGADRPRRG